MRLRWPVLVGVSLFLSISGCGKESDAPKRAEIRVLAQPTRAELNARRGQLMAAHSDGLILIPGNAAEKGMTDPGWMQAPTFQYFSGLAHLPGALLVLDPATNQSTLFAGPAPSAFGVPIPALDATQFPEVAAGAYVYQILPSSVFVGWLSDRLSVSDPVLYLDSARRPEPTGSPIGLLPVQGFHALWEQSLRDAYPDAELRSMAETVRTLRWVKSESEIAELHQNAVATAYALRQGMRAIGVGVGQRMAEAAVVAGCLEAGAEGPSFWPWMMVGPNGGFGRLVQSFFDYSSLNRVMEAGQLVRADVGCQGGGYGGDVGRTVPVSGAFTPAQAQVWDLLIDGYLAGLNAMRPGLPLDSVRAASRRRVAERGSEDASIAELALAFNAPSGVDWHIHGVGIESGETPGGQLEAGVVLAYEPMIVVGDDAFYLEDMILITPSGAEVLSSGLPYSAVEMEAFLAR
ncbi:MAG: Xaa-Pro aminopeptidase [Rhodothermales bacterium]|jgi:Xaa-Pro aminopeptidase